MKKRLAIVTTHPIQYNAPLFRLLTQRGRIEIKVFYTWGPDVLAEKFDPGFQRVVKWDIDLLSGYDHIFVENIARDKGSHHFSGIDNPGLKEEIWAYKPDSILVYGWPFKSHVRIMRHFKNKLPVLFRGDSVIKLTDSTLRSWMKKIYLGWVYRFIDIALYAGKLNRSYFERYGLKGERLVHMPHAVDNDFFRTVLSNSTAQVQQLRREIGIPEHVVVFLYAGKLDQNKNIYLLLRSFLDVHDGKAHLVIAGEGVERGALMSEFGAYHFIHFLPFQNQSQMPILYGICDVFVLPSYNETWGLSVNEAMACGRAVLISSGVGCSADLCIDGVNGFVFPSGNREALGKCLADMMSDPALLKCFSEASLKRIASFSFLKQSEAIERTLDPSLIGDAVNKSKSL